MDRFKNMLVTASEGQLEVPVLRAAARLAETNEAELTVLGVIDPLPARRRTASIEGRVVDFEESLATRRSHELREVIQEAGTPEVAVEVTAGRFFSEVIRHATAHDSDLVIVGRVPASRHGGRGIDPEVLQLLRNCPVPVWVMCPRTVEQQRVLALVDPDPTDRERDSLNDRVMELATAIVRRERGKLHVAHAWEFRGEAALRHSGFIALPDHEVNMMVQTVEEEHRSRVEQLCQHHGVTELGGQVHLVKGPPTAVLPGLVEQIDADLIVMGTVARAGISGMIMGNTAETILRSVPCSVLTVKPDGFVSPVGSIDG